MTRKRKIVVLCFCFLVAQRVQSQGGARVGDQVPDFAVTNVLNRTQASSTFRKLNSKLLLIDFFGTWCVPCIKALPKLSALQERFQNELVVILVSEEKQTKLTAFLQKQVDFKLPVVVDDSGHFGRIFQPPSYPYTVVVAENGKILALPLPEAINEENIKQWLRMQNNEGVNTNPDPGTPAQKTMMTAAHQSREYPENKVIQLSQDLVYAAKTGDNNIIEFTNKIRGLTMEELASNITTDDDKKAFWINLYNGFTQVSLQKDSTAYTKRSKFFGARQHQVAGHRFSLDDIEHGILRRSKIKWSLGYANKIFASYLEKRLRVDRLDYRIHFALNCGAKSCPPIAFYKAGDINDQLDQATRAYLASEVMYDPANNMVFLPKLMSWFRRDFGGKKKMITLLERLSLLPPGIRPKIKFKPYDWTLQLQNYKP